jgi:glycosyltransferase involved in cell wall biosynthesis
MRVLFVHKFFPGQFLHLARALAGDPANEVVFVHAEGEGEIPRVRKVRIAPSRAVVPSTHHYVQGFETAVLLGQAAYRACSGLRDGGFRPDVIYAHAGFGPGLYLKDVFPDAPLLGYFEWYYRAQGADADFLDAHVEPDEALRIRTRNAGVLLELANCDRGVCPTAFQRDQFPPDLRGKLTVLHDGVDVESFGARQDHVDGIPADAEIVTYATRGLEPYRGFPQFMAAIDLLQKRRPMLHAVVAGADETYYGRPPAGGGGHKRAVLDSLPHLDRTRLHFRGFLKSAEYRAMLLGSHVHVYLTVPFVLSWSLLEAMVAGCAIVGSDTPPVREVLRHGETGLLADMREPERIADAIERLLDDRALAARLASAARETVAGRYALMRLLPKQIALLRAMSRRVSAPELRLEAS